MEARRKTAVFLSEDVRSGFGRVSSKGGFDKNPEQMLPGGDQPFPPKPGGFGNASAKRQIPDDHQFDKNAIKPLVKSLWAMSVALGHALTAHRQFSRLKSSTFSPDGMVGGRGYVMPVKEVRQQLFEACENLSGLVDTLHDEINGPHWKPKLADLEKADMSEIERLLSDAEEWVDNPEEETESEMEGVDQKGNSAWTKERFKEDGKTPRSDIPGGGDKETLQKSGPGPGSSEHPDMKHMKQASAGYDRRPGVRETHSSFLDREVPLTLLAIPEVSPELRALYARFYQSNSSVDPGTLPGPRVDHLDRADVDQTGPEGSYNREDPAVTDDWGESGGVSGEPMSDNTGDNYAYPSAYNGEMNNTASGLRTVAYIAPGDPRWQWSLDCGKRGATSKEEEVAAYDSLPSRTIYNPHAVMPGDPEAPLGDRTKNDHYETVEDKTANYDRTSVSGVPDSNTDSTPTQGFDFGIGDGNGNDAHGQGAGGYGVSNPGAPDSNPGSGVGNQGVYGPSADLPNDPGGSTRDRENDGTNEKVELGIGNNSVPSVTAQTLETEGAGKLPNDDEGPVARSDYYWGDKGNDFNTDMNRAAAPTEAESRTPGNNAPQPAAPMTARPMNLNSWEFAAQAPSSEEPLSSSDMPGDESAEYESAPGYSPDEYHRVEHGDQPYVKFDDTTHNMRPDWNYQRGDLPAPYVNQTTP